MTEYTCQTTVVPIEKSGIKTQAGAHLAHRSSEGLEEKNTSRFWRVGWSSALPPRSEAVATPRLPLLFLSPPGRGPRLGFLRRGSLFRWGPCD